MTVAYTSDIHINSSAENSELVNAIRVRLAEVPPDIFILAGDISSSIADIRRAFEFFSDIPCIKLFVPGNHDIWTEDGITSDGKYFELLPKLCEEHGVHPLWMEPYPYGGTVFCGSMGWYDLSLRTHLVPFTDEDYAKKRYHLLTWMDKLRVRFHGGGRVLSDGELTDMLLERYIADCEKSAAKADRIISVFHHLPFREAVDYIGRPGWDYFSAFYGSARFGEYILSNPKISHTFCGHYHRKKSLDIPAPDTSGALSLFMSPFGYYEREGDKPFGEWIKKRLSILKI
jgi:hypothetical protein